MATAPGGQAFTVQGSITVDTKQATASIQQLGQTITTLAPVANQMAVNITVAMQKVEGAAKQTKDSMAGVMQAFAGNALVGQLKSLAGGILGATTEWASYQRTLQAVTHSQAETASLMALITRYANTTPFDTGAIAQATVHLRAMNVDVDKALRISTQLAAVFKVDLQHSSRMVAEAMTGNARGAEMMARNFGFSRQEMQRLGVAMDNNGEIMLRGKNDTEAFARALEKFTAEKGGAGAFGGFAVSISNFRSELYLLATEIGSHVMPSLIQLVDWGTQQVAWFRSLSPEVKTAAGAIVFLVAGLGTLLAALAPLAITLSAVSGAVGGAAGLAGGLATAAAAVGTFGTALGVLTTAGVAGAVVLGILSIKNSITDLIAEFEKGDGAAKQFAEDMDKISPSAKKLAESVRPSAEAGRNSNEADVDKRIAGMSLRDLNAVSDYYKNEANRELASGEPGAATPAMDILQKLARQAAKTTGSAGDKKIAAGIIGTAADVRRTFEEQYPSILAEGLESSKKLSAMMAKQIEGLRGKKEASGFVGPVQKQRPVVDIERDVQVAEHLSKIGELSEKQEMAKLQVLEKELKANADAGIHMDLQYKLSEKIYGLRKKIAETAATDLEAQKALATAKGEFTPEAELAYLGKKRTLLEENRKLKLVSAEDEKKALGQIEAEEAGANKKKVDRDRDISAQLVGVAKGEAAQRLAELTKLDDDMKKLGVDSVSREKILADKRVKIVEDEAQRIKDIRDAAASEKAKGAGSAMDAHIKQLESRRSRGEDVTGELSTLQKQKGEKQALEIERQGAAEVDALRRKRRLENNADARNALDEEIKAKVDATKAQAASARQAAGIEAEDTLRERQKQVKEEALRARQIRGEALAGQGQILQSRLEAGDPRAGTQLLDNMRAQFDIQKSILEAERDKAMFGATAAEKANAQAEFEVKLLQLKRDALKTTKDTTAEIEKQKQLQDDARVKKEGGDFTTGQIYGSVAEAFAKPSGADDADSGSYASWRKRRQTSRTRDEVVKTAAQLGIGLDHIGGSDVIGGNSQGHLPPDMAAARAEKAKASTDWILASRHRFGGSNTSGAGGALEKLVGQGLDALAPGETRVTGEATLTVIVQGPSGTQQQSTQMPLTGGGSGKNPVVPPGRKGR